MMAQAVIYSRAGCHLCDIMAAKLQPLLERKGITLQWVDIDADPALKQRFGLRIPVFMLDGEIVCEGRTDEDAVRDALQIR